MKKNTSVKVMLKTQKHLVMSLEMIIFGVGSQGRRDSEL